MGIDVNIWVRTRDGQPPPDPTADRGPIWGGSRIRAAWGEETWLGATHFIATGDRYWDETWEENRASRWPQIRRTLTDLLGHCESVWYASDSYFPGDEGLRGDELAACWRSFGEAHLVTPERLAVLDAAYKWATAGQDDAPVIHP